jgi:hypothetical protein
MIILTTITSLLNGADPTIREPSDMLLRKGFHMIKMKELFTVRPPNSNLSNTV